MNGGRWTTTLHCGPLVGREGGLRSDLTEPFQAAPAQLQTQLPLLLPRGGQWAQHCTALITAGASPHIAGALLARHHCVQLGCAESSYPSPSIFWPLACPLLLSRLVPSLLLLLHLLAALFSAMSAHSRFNYGSYGSSNTNNALFKFGLAAAGFFTGALVGAFLPDLILKPTPLPPPPPPTPTQMPLSAVGQSARPYPLPSCPPLPSPSLLPPPTSPRA